MRTLFNVAVTSLSGVAALSLGAAVAGMSEGKAGEGSSAKERSDRQSGYELLEPPKRNAI